MWFIFDLVINYPFQTAVVILTLYAFSYLSSTVSRIFGFIFGGWRNGGDYKDAPPRPAEVAVVHRHDDINALTGRINGMERRTDLLNKRVESMCITLDRVLQNMAHEDDLDE